MSGIRIIRIERPKSDRGKARFTNVEWSLIVDALTGVEVA